jgi:hypothetical protein
LDKKYIFYRAFEKLPVNDEEVNNYGFSRRGEKINGTQQQVWSMAG